MVKESLNTKGWLTMIAATAGCMLTLQTIFAEDEEFIFGDANSNGAVNVVDVQCTILTALNEMTATPPPECFTVPIEQIDVNCDDKITVVDVSAIVGITLDKGLNSQIDSNYNSIPDCLEDKCKEYSYGYSYEFGYGYGYAEGYNYCTTVLNGDTREQYFPNKSERNRGRP